MSVGLAFLGGSESRQTARAQANPDLVVLDDIPNSAIFIHDFAT